MAGVPKKVKVEDIDLLLRDAEIGSAQLHILHHRLINLPDVDEIKREAIELKCAMIFKDMMGSLYSVLDQIFYFLYCYFQNNGDVSLSNAASQIKQPMKQDLKWSEDDTHDGQPECKKKRNDWVTDQCKKIFGDNYPDPEHYGVRYFQENLLQLQAIKKVDQSGNEVLRPDGGPTLVRACNIQHDAAGNVSEFNPSSVTFTELIPVESMVGWDDTTVFNLLYFFRNFTCHKSLIACPIKDGFLNLETREFKFGDKNSPGFTRPWVFIKRGIWVSVPELSHLRQKENAPLLVETKFHQYPLLQVCKQVFAFVLVQRHNLCHVVRGENPFIIPWYPYRITWDLLGMIHFQKHGQDLGKCEWDRAKLWPLGNYPIDSQELQPVYFLHHLQHSDSNCLSKRHGTY